MDIKPPEEPCTDIALPRAVLELQLLWDDLDSICTTKASSIGFRVSLGDGSVVTKGVSRTSEKVSLALQTFPTKTASVYIVCVHEGEARGETQVVKFGIAENIALNDGTITHLSNSDIKWVDPGWRVDPEYQKAFDAGTFTADKDAQRFELPLYVTDPFQVGETLSSWYDLWIGVKGSGISYNGNSDGWRLFTLVSRNPNPGQAGTSSHIYRPGLNGLNFGLSGTYYIGPAVEFTVEWK